MGHVERLINSGFTHALVAFFDGEDHCVLCGEKTEQLTILDPEGYRMTIMGHKEKTEFSKRCRGPWIHNRALLELNGLGFMRESLPCFDETCNENYQQNERSGR